MSLCIYYRSLCCAVFGDYPGTPKAVEISGEIYVIENDESSESNSAEADSTNDDDDGAAEDTETG